MSDVAPGWYADPTNPLQERLWDGSEWMDKVRPKPPAQSISGVMGAPTSFSFVQESHRDSGPVASIRQVVSFSSGNIFKGRISRSAIAWWVVLMFLVRITLSTVESTVQLGALLNFVAGTISLVTFALTLSAWVRRLHDIGKSGKYLFWFLVPVVGLVYLIVLASRRGDPVTNIYGPVPL